MKNMNFKRIMIFGRPGSGKSTFASFLADTLGMPVYHLDKYVYQEHWVEVDYNNKVRIQQDIISRPYWIIDGNVTIAALFEERWSSSDLVVYVNFPKILCLYRILKRFFYPNAALSDRALNCRERISFSFLKYMWYFDKRVAPSIAMCKERYPDVVFREIRNKKDMLMLENVLYKT